MIAVFPTRLPVPTIPIDGSGNGSSAGGSKRKSAPTYGSPAASTRLASRKRSLGPSTGSSERSTTSSGPVLGERGVQIGRDADAVVGVVAQLLGAADDVRGDEVVRELLERSPDDRRVVLAVDEGEGTHHERVVTSSSIRPVYFSYSNVSSENWMIRSWPWNGCLRQTATWLPETSTTL